MPMAQSWQKMQSGQQHKTDLLLKSIECMHKSAISCVVFSPMAVSDAHIVTQMANLKLPQIVRTISD